MPASSARLERRAGAVDLDVVRRAPSGRSPGSRAPARGRPRPIWQRARPAIASGIAGLALRGCGRRSARPRSSSPGARRAAWPARSRPLPAPARAAPREALDERLDLALRQRADEAVDRLAVPEGVDRRDRLDAQLLRDLRVLVDVDLDHADLAVGVLDRASRAAGPSCLQGPHQGAQKSTITGWLCEAWITSCDEVLGVAVLDQPRPRRRAARSFPAVPTARPFWSLHPGAFAGLLTWRSALARSRGGRRRCRARRHRPSRHTCQALPVPLSSACDQWRAGGRSSGVEHNLAKVGVEGSNPFARSSLRAAACHPTWPPHDGLVVVRS